MTCPKVLGTHLENDPSHLSSCSSQPRLIPDASCLRHPPHINRRFTNKARQSEDIGLLKPKFPFHLAAFNVRTLCKNKHWFCPVMDAINKLDEVAVSNFRTYLRFRTVHPNPNYEPAVAWIRDQADQLGLTSFRTEIFSGNPIIVLRWIGSEPELPSILLNSHMDVVPVDAAKWSHPPFDATLTNDGYIYARGAQDMKCVGIQQLEAIRRLKARGIAQLRRTVYLTFVPDEELGGKLGMRPFVAGEKPTSDQLANEIDFIDLNVGFCLDEGLPSPSDSYLAFYDERRPCWMTVRFEGSAGHGLTLLDNTAGEKFQRFLDR
ncbi:unnamed protein product [Echinostoma caproni]|uniref:N-acyl-L-amino-acid amidohydrolase n=1 Tax=Echinostoma caproni TaxID=27848 RepID=A0A183B4E0_9TREM|nr:unnamed protein product [Echinostoma caproni]